jgi:ribonuclease PH
MNEKPDKLIDKKGIRLDGRKADELRPLKVQVGVLSNADGSAYIEHGKNKILAAAFGPREMHPKHLALADRMVLRCRTDKVVKDRRIMSSLLTKVKLKQISSLLEKGNALDERGLTRYREIKIEQGVIEKAEGSARLLGKNPSSRRR